MKLHDSTRRFLALLIFFLLGPILTVGLLLGIGLRKLPSNAKRYEYELSARTGLPWKIEAVEYRSPNCVRLIGVGIVDEASGRTVFDSDRIDISRVESKNMEKIFASGIEADKNAIPAFPFQRLFGGGSTDGFLLVSVPNSVVKFDHYPSDEASAAVIRATLSRILARFPRLAETPVQFVFENVGVFSRYGREKAGKHKFEPLRFVRGNLYRTKDGVRSDWSFQMPEVSELETQRFSIVRQNTGQVEIELRTGRAPVPCDMAAIVCPAFGRCGPGSRFSGDFSVQYHGDTENSRTIRLGNILFQNIDIARLASDYTAFDVSGTVADFRIPKATMGPDLFYVEGFFKIVHGRIDSNLFNRFVQQFELTVRPREILESPRAAIPFEECAVHFQMRENGITFWPDELWPDGMMMSQSGDGIRMNPMTVHFPTEHRRPVSYHAILSLLAPDTAPVVPLTPNLKKLYSVIPVMDTRLPRNRPDSVPETPEQEVLATTPRSSAIMSETIRNSRTEPRPSQAPIYPAIANPR